MISKVRTLIIISIFLVWSVGCGLQQGMEASKTRLSMSEVSATYGELPSTQDGSEITEFSLLTTNGKAVNSTDLYDGKASHDIQAGENLLLIAEVKTNKGKTLYLAQRELSDYSLVEGYVTSSDIVQLGESEVNIPENVIPTEPTPTEPDPEPAVSNCPSISVAGSFGTKGNDLHKFVWGDQFRQNNKYGPNPKSPELVLSSSKGASLARITTTKLNNGEQMDPATVELDGSDGEQVINFQEFIVENNWSESVIKIEVELLGSNTALSESEAPTKCGVEIKIMSPIVLDFTSSAFIKTTSVLNSKTSFDLNADGIKETTGWTEKGTALLALDINNNGSIDDGGELFGNFTQLNNGLPAKNGYEALQMYLVLNPYSGSRIDKYNPIYDNLIVWFDNNKDGVSQFNEMQTLAGAGVRSLDTNYTQVPTHQQNNQLFSNQVKYQSRFYGSACPDNGCSSYDVFFSTIGSLPSQAAK